MFFKVSLVDKCDVYRYKMDSKPCPNKSCGFTYKTRKKPVQCPVCNAYIGNDTLVFLLFLKELGRSES